MADATSRLLMFVGWFGDGLVAGDPDGFPLYSRDIEAVTAALAETGQGDEGWTCPGCDGPNRSSASHYTCAGSHRPAPVVPDSPDAARDGFCTCHPDRPGRTADCGIGAHRLAVVRPTVTATEWGVQRDEATPMSSRDAAERTIERQRSRKGGYRITGQRLIRREVTPWVAHPDVQERSNG